MASVDLALSESRARVPRPASRCSVCHRSIAVMGAGVVRQHGPVRSRCPGSGRPPALPGPGSPGLDNGRGVSTPSTTQPALSTSSLSSASPLRPLRPSVKILKRIPRASRELLGKKLAVILEAVVRNNDRASWDRLLRFGARCLRHPRPVRGGRRWALATAVNSQLREEADPPAASPPTGSLSGEANLLHQTPSSSWLPGCHSS